MENEESRERGGPRAALDSLIPGSLNNDMHSSPRPSPGAAPARLPAPGGRGGGLFVFLILAVTVIGLAFFLPIVPCPSCRGILYQERMRQAANATPAHAAAIREFALAEECAHCRRGRKTLMAFLANTGGCLSWW